ncbi:hypothetical protein [Bifidobacterium sp.]|uniref:hypothetical protein n=1 Tax=Bifidobacterium sp. TaxID=41200 RepID=UPI0025B822B9|nr:hypothetical protein [Bifidobacterium sp.]MCH4209237.1 hypothetical protein [Bifidobacterium sp.]
MLQPYTLEAEVKSLPYQAAIGLTYMACWLFAKDHQNSSLLLFSGLVISFCAAYSVLACAPVYAVASHTFRLKA